MFVSIHCKSSLFNAHTMILIVHIFMTVNKLCLNQRHIMMKRDSGSPQRKAQVWLKMMKTDSGSPQRKTQVSFIMMKTDSRGPQRKTHVVLIIMKTDSRSPQRNTQGGFIMMKIRDSRNPQRKTQVGLNDEKGLTESTKHTNIQVKSHL